MNESKKIKTKETLKKTKSRRSLLSCKTYELKFDLSHLSNKKLEDLKLLFLESKWLYNHILSQNDIFQVDTKLNVVNALDKNKKPITKELNIIGSQIKQGIHTRMLESIESLKALKENGYKVGKLKFKSRINSIPLKQFGNTYKFHEVKPNYIKIQNIKGYFKVTGIKQIPKNAEFANAKLINKHNNFYLHITCFIPKIVKEFPEKETGLDFGIETTLTLMDDKNNIKKYDIDIPESKRSRKLRKRLSRKQGSKKKSKKSKSYLKNLSLLNNSINKTTNLKIDKKNKIVSEITNTYETICVQDDDIKEWQEGNFGKTVHNSALGGIKRALFLKAHTLKALPKWDPTSQLCGRILLDGSRCMKLNKFELHERTYSCECGNVQDRDPHSAYVTLEIGTGRISREDLEKIKKVHMDDIHSKILMEEVSSAIVGKTLSEKSEAHEFIRG